MLSSCYVNDSLLNYVLYTLHTIPVPASPGRGDSILAGVSSAPGTLPAEHTIIHALLMFYKSCSLYLGCCAAHPSIHVTHWPLQAWWMNPCAYPGKVNVSASPLPCLSSAPHQTQGQGYPCFQDTPRAGLTPALPSWLQKPTAWHRQQGSKSQGFSSAEEPLQSLLSKATESKRLSALNLTCLRTHHKAVIMLQASSMRLFLGRGIFPRKKRHADSMAW